MMKRLVRLLAVISMVFAVGTTGFAQGPTAGESLAKLKGYRYLPYAVSRSAERAGKAGAGNGTLVESFKVWAKAHEQGVKESNDVAVALSAASAKGDANEVGRLTALKAAKDEELFLADEVLKMEVGGEVGDDGVDAFLASVVAETALITAELAPDERVAALGQDAFAQMNAAVQLMNHRAMGGQGIPADRVEALNRSLGDLRGRYEEIIRLIRQLEKQ